MSAQAAGIMQILLPKENVSAFEELFNPDNPKSFPNAKIILTEDISEELCGKEFSRRNYDIECSYSVYGCLLECIDSIGFDFHDVCKMLEVREAEIDTHQPYDKFREQIFISPSKPFRYDTQDDEEECELD